MIRIYTALGLDVNFVKPSRLQDRFQELCGQRAKRDKASRGGNKRSFVNCTCTDGAGKSKVTRVHRKALERDERFDPKAESRKVERQALASYFAELEADRQERSRAARKRAARQRAEHLQREVQKRELNAHNAHVIATRAEFEAKTRRAMRPKLRGEELRAHVRSVLLPAKAASLGVVVGCICAVPGFLPPLELK